MTPQLKNMNELVAYLESLENRIRSLERENEALQGQKDQLNRYLQDLGGDAQKLLPKTGLISPNFLQRAFTVWGHYFVAQLIISVPILCVYFIIAFLLIQNGISILPTP